MLENYPDTVEYGAHRVLGRAYSELPFFAGGSYSKSKKYLNEAYEKTMHDTLGTSINVRTTLYLLNTLQEMDEDGEFCDVYDPFSDLMPLSEETARELNPERVLENLLDMKMFDNPPGDQDWIEEVQEYADINC